MCYNSWYIALLSSEKLQHEVSGEHVHVPLQLIVNFKLIIVSKLHLHNIFDISDKVNDLRVLRDLNR